MDRAIEKRLAERAVTLGRDGWLHFKGTRISVYVSA